LSGPHAGVAPGRLQPTAGLARSQRPAGKADDAPGPWGNPFSIDELATTFDRAAAQAKTVAMARDWLQGGLDPALSPGDPPSLTTIRHELGGHNLACWCRPGTPCHADVLIELANR
jgi:hypothetical protein